MAGSSPANASPGQHRPPGSARFGSEPARLLLAPDEAPTLSCSLLHERKTLALPVSVLHQLRSPQQRPVFCASSLRFALHSPLSAAVVLVSFAAAPVTVRYHCPCRRSLSLPPSSFAAAVPAAVRCRTSLISIAHCDDRCIARSLPLRRAFPIASYTGSCVQPALVLHVVCLSIARYSG